MRKFVRESLYDSFKINENEDEDDDIIAPEVMADDDVEVEDEWEKPEEEEIEPEMPPVDSADMEDDEITVDDTQYTTDIEDILANELQFSDINREREFILGKKGITGTVMAKLSNGNYVFKTPEGMKKFNIKEVNIDEGVKPKKGKKLNEIVKHGYEYEYVDYLFDIAGFLMLNPENVQAILNIHNVVDEEEAKIEITNELEDNEALYGVRRMFDSGVEPEDAADKILNQYQG